MGRWAGARRWAGRPGRGSESAGEDGDPARSGRSGRAEPNGVAAEQVISPQALWRRWVHSGACCGILCGAPQGQTGQIVRANGITAQPPREHHAPEPGLPGIVTAEASRGSLHKWHTSTLV